MDSCYTCLADQQEAGELTEDDPLPELGILGITPMHEIDSMEYNYETEEQEFPFALHPRCEINDANETHSCKLDPQNPCCPTL